MEYRVFIATVVKSDEAVPLAGLFKTDLNLLANKVILSTPGEQLFSTTPSSLLTLDCHLAAALPAQ
jgi:hypothetical protein